MYSKWNCHRQFVQIQIKGRSQPTSRAAHDPSDCCGRCHIVCKLQSFMLTCKSLNNCDAKLISNSCCQVELIPSFKQFSEVEKAKNVHYDKLPGTGGFSAQPGTVVG